MPQANIHTGYVITEDGTILIQTPADNQWGFTLHDDDQSWPGGFGIAGSWEVMADNDPRITQADRERLGWIVEAVEESGKAQAEEASNRAALLAQAEED